jgi:hypothetical protein
LARWLPQGVLLALAGEAVAGRVVEGRGGLVFDGAAEVEVLILLGGVVGDAIEVPCVGNACSGDVVVDGAADLGGAGGLPT